MEREHITNRAHGIDVSHWQEQFVLAKTWGQIDFGIAKIGEGYNSPYNSKVDGKIDEFNKLWIGGVADIAIRGLYFYQRSGYSWELQATNVLKAIERLEVKPHFLACDVEKGNNILDKTMAADTRRIVQFWKANSKLKILGYWNPDVFEILYNLGLVNYGQEYVDWLLALENWLAQYWFFASPNKQPGTPKHRATWNLWQYDDGADSFKIVDGTQWRHYGSPDVDVYNGTVAQMRTWLGLDVPPPQPPPAEQHELGLVYADKTTQAQTVVIQLRQPVAQIRMLALDNTGFILPSAPEPPPGPGPEPEPPPVVVDWPRFGILRKQIIENRLTLAGKFTPAVVQIEDEPKPDSKKGDPIPLLVSAQAFIQKINDKRGAHYALDTVGAMWINSPGRGESISCQFNFKSWEKEENNCAQLRCFQHDEDFGKFDPAKVNWYTRPDVFFKAMAINLKGEIAKVGDGIDCTIPFMARSKAAGGTGELWLSLDEIEPFPRLPIDVTVVASSLHVRKSPGLDGEIIGDYAGGGNITLLEYRPLGASVWARTPDGWICLLLAEKPGQRQFLTSWQLETPGVIPPGQ